MEVALSVRPLDKFPMDEKKELYGAWINERLKFMLYKGIKYIPAIGYSAYKLLPSYERLWDYFLKVPPAYDEILTKAYRQLKRKVRGAKTVRAGKRLWEDGWMELYGVTRVVWPPTVLDVKEVRDETKQLLEREFYSKDDPEDRKIMRDFLVNEVKEEIPEDQLETHVDKLIEGINRDLKNWGKFFAKLLEIRIKYPDAMFYLFAHAV